MKNTKEILDNWTDNSKKLFFITNSGCDDSTHGLAEMSREEYIKFAEIVDNLNSNSTYSCMPTINCEETEWKCFTTYESRSKDKDDWEFNESDKFRFNGVNYTYAKGHDVYTINCHAPVRVYYTKSLDKVPDLEIGF